LLQRCCSTFAAATTASRRAPGIRGALPLSFYAIAAGAGVVIAAMLATRTLTADIVVLGPVYIHFVQRTAATRLMMAAKHLSVFS
jgi:hypothetical protein